MLLYFELPSGLIQVGTVSGGFSQAEVNTVGEDTLREGGGGPSS